MSEKKIFLISGEISGDINTAALVTEIKKHEPSFTFVGIGGKQMSDAGVEILYDSSNWGSIGFFEGITKFPTVYPVLRKLHKIFSSLQPDVFVPVDYRVFNMNAAKIAHSLNIPVVYYYAPISWFGSGKKRFEELAKYVNVSLITLPFSLDDYNAAGANYVFIGSPLLDTVKPSMSKMEAAEFFGIESDKLIVGLMPGSRSQEIKRLLPEFLHAAIELKNQNLQKIQFLLMIADIAVEKLIKNIIAKAGMENVIKIAYKNRYDFMNLCDLLIVCSGTATHELTIMQKPMVVTYKLSALTAYLARRMLKIPFISLPNIISNTFVVPELVQENCMAENIAQEVKKLLSNPENNAKIVEELGSIKQKLGVPGALQRAAETIIKIAKNKKAGLSRQ